ncbi:MAG: NAD-dependent epimerase/dehydratase family protein, partial [Myxococcota bacterium]
MMRALVTGAGGFVGGALARALQARGDDVVTLQRSPVPALERDGIRCLRGDIGQRDDVMRAATGCDVVFHVAAKVGGAGARRDFERINVDGTQHVLDACGAEGVRRLVFCSSPSVVDAPEGVEFVDENVPYAARYLADYPRTKAMAEQLV